MSRRNVSDTPEKQRLFETGNGEVFQEFAFKNSLSGSRNRLEQVS